MKTTVDIADKLLEEVRKVISETGITLKEAIETGLNLLLKSSKLQSKFTLRDASVEGNGITPEFANAGWEGIREAVYTISAKK